MSPGALRTICTILAASGLILGSPAYADRSLIPGSYPLSAASQLDIKKNVTMNGNPVVKGKTGADSVVEIDGTRNTVSQLPPDLDPCVVSS